MQTTNILSCRVSLNAAGQARFGVSSGLVQLYMDTVIFIGHAWKINFLPDGASTSTGIDVSAGDANSADTDALVARLNAIGPKMYVLTDVAAWFNRQIRALFKDYIGTAATPPPASGTVTAATIIDSVATVFPSEFTMHIAADGFPTVEAK